MINKKVNPPTSGFDKLKWILIVILIAASVWGNQHYHQVDWALRLAGWIVVASVILAIATQTAAGKRFWQFAKDARSEMRKVSWPTRQETMQTTALVVVMVIITAVILWGIDSVLLWLVGFLTGQRG